MAGRRLRLSSESWPKMNSPRVGSCGRHTGGRRGTAGRPWAPYPELRRRLAVRSKQEAAGFVPNWLFVGALAKVVHADQMRGRHNGRAVTR